MQKRKRLLRRHLKTAFLAFAATATFVWSAIDIFDADPRMLWDFFTMSVLGLGVLMLAAAVLVLLLKLIKR